MTREFAELGVTAVQQGVVPPYAYTQDLGPRLGVELICAGALRYSVYQVASILRGAAWTFSQEQAAVGSSFECEGLGLFEVRVVHADWLRALIPESRRVSAGVTWWQVAPIRPYWTVDVPDLSTARSHVPDPAWRWLDHPWDLPAPSNSHLVTTLSVLSGGVRPQTIFRWEADQWEALDQPPQQIDRSDVRVVPLGLLVSLVDDWGRFLHLDVGSGCTHVSGRWDPAE